MITGRYGQSGLRLEPRQRGGRCDVDGINVRVLGVPYSQSMSMPRRMVSFLQFMLGACRESMKFREVDVVFATSTPLTIAVPGLWAAWWHRCPFVFEVRDLWPDAPVELGILRSRLLIRIARGLERLACRRAAHVIALSPGMKAGVLAAGADERKVTVIPNFSDVELFRVPPEMGQAYRAKQGAIGSRPWVVYAGTMGRVNGVDWAVRLAARVARLNPEIVFWLVGDGSEKGRVMAEAASRGLLDRTVFFRDPVPRSELPRVLSAATILSSFCQDLPVLRTNSANKFFDAFAAGRPVLVNYGGWQAEILEREGAGLALPSSDLDGAAERLVCALGDATWLEQAGIASRRLGDTEFNCTRLAGQLESILSDVVARGKSDARTGGPAATARGGKP